MKAYIIKHKPKLLYQVSETKSKWNLFISLKQITIYLVAHPIATSLSARVVISLSIWKHWNPAHHEQLYETMITKTEQILSRISDS